VAPALTAGRPSDESDFAFNTSSHHYPISHVLSRERPALSPSPAP
jgi:hypothetical protein